MMKRLYPLIFIVFLATCREPAPDLIPLPTRICVEARHHERPIPYTRIYLKYNADTFPGYNQPASYYDAIFDTNLQAKGCKTAIPEGKHWLVAFGYDSLLYPHIVFGSLPFTIDLTTRPELDTLIAVSEEH